MAEVVKRDPRDPCVTFGCNEGSQENGKQIQLVISFVTLVTLNLFKRLTSNRLCPPVAGTQQQRQLLHREMRVIEVTRVTVLLNQWVARDLLFRPRVTVTLGGRAHPRFAPKSGGCHCPWVPLPECAAAEVAERVSPINPKILESRQSGNRHTCRK